MKHFLIISLFLIAFIIGCNNTQSNKNVDIATKTDSVSYSIGLDIGRNFKKQDIEVSPEVLVMGIKHALQDTSFLTDEQVKKVMTNFQNDMRTKQNEKLKAASEQNKAEEEKFFAENKKKEGVITLDNGIQYKVLKSGNGKSPKLSSTVEVNYEGRLIDGTKFDSSYDRGTPFKTKLTGVIKGWTEILQRMKEGDKWEVYIPSKLAYGPRGAGKVIGPDAALIFQMELISVQ